MVFWCTAVDCRAFDASWEGATGTSWKAEARQGEVESDWNDRGKAEETTHEERTQSSQRQGENGMG